MPSVTAHAPAKSILFGEHAVVYGHPAIAIPVFERRASTYILADPRGEPGKVNIQAPDIDLDTTLSILDPDHPFRIAIDLTCEAVGVSQIPACQIRIVSAIPIASGLGSGASIAVSLARALSQFLGHPLPDEQVSAIAFEVDKVYHGTPSGIDNTVIAYGKPVFFIKDQPFTLLAPGCPLDLLIADSGVRSSTREMVMGLRARWETDKPKIDGYFDAIGGIVSKAREFIASGSIKDIGIQMTENQHLLQELGVSHPALETLIKAALTSGAHGAKLSGAGGGGNMIALVDDTILANVDAALRAAGATNVIHTRVTAGKA